MKKLLLFLLLAGFCSSQEIKEQYSSYKDFDFQKQPKKISKIHYEFIDKVAVDQSKEVFLFDEFGNITSISETDFNDSENNFKTTYEYRNGRLTKECVQSEKKNLLLRCNNYEYNAAGLLVKKVLKSNDDYTETSTYQYEGNQMKKILVDFDGDSSLQQDFFYNSKGELYLIKSTETLSNGKKFISTDAYSKGKLLFQRDHEGTNTFLYHKEPNMELQFLVKGKKTLAYLELLEERLAKEDRRVESDLSYLIFDHIKNEKEIKSQNINVFKRNENQDIIANGSMKDVSKPMQDVSFQQIEYADGTVSGSEDFDIFIYNELNRMKK